VIATGFSGADQVSHLPVGDAVPAVSPHAEEPKAARASRFFVPGGPNSEYGINQTDDYEIPAILRKQMD
jgi:hypothetical protein